MTIEEFRNYCLSKRGSSESFPFDEDVLVFKVLNKMFALTSLKKWEEGDHSVNLKCDPEKAIAYREKYPDDVYPGYHMSKKHWNTVQLDGSLADSLIFALINDSYDLVVKSLPKKTQYALFNT